MINVPSHVGQDWTAITAVARKHILGKLHRILGRDIEPLIACETVLDPVLIETRTSSHGGSLYGTSSNNRFAAFLRHKNFSDDIKGLYFCGGSVHPGGGIPLCLNSAKIVAGLVESDFG
jgi:phytoene dehydrogenase-like protein